MSRFTRIARGGLSLMRSAPTAYDSRPARIARAEAQRYGDVAMLGLRPRPGTRV